MKSILSLYAKFRTSGYDAKQSLRSAKIITEFKELESQGLVRLRAEPEEESYLDSYGKRIAFSKLPTDCQKLVMQDLKPI